MTHKKTFVFFISFWVCATLYSQILTPFQNITIIQEGDTLTNPFAGGMNCAQFSLADFNFDGQQDLFTFDKDGDFPSVFLCTSVSPVTYSFAPEFKSYFPPTLKHWVLLRDYNCDGLQDLYTTGSYSNAIYIYPNTSSGTTLSFSQTPIGPLTADGDTITVFETDIPTIIDVDNDDDLDILSFDTQGFFMVFFENKSQDLYQDCNHVEFTINNTCWGQFREEGLNNDIFLNVACKSETGYESSPLSSRHSGSTVTAFDKNNDGAKELLIGDISFDNLVYLNNGGTATTPDMDQFIYQFPDYDQPVSLTTFPAAYMIDVDIDGLTDMIVTPNNVNVGANYKNVLFYKNVGSTNNAVFELQQRDFLQNTMIDCGTAARPFFFDYNQDGLQDLLIGNDRYKTSSSFEESDLTLYKNIGTASQPSFEFVTSTYLDLKSLFDSPAIFGVHPTFGDLDADGDQDLILGDYEGKLHYFRNEATAGNPASFNLISPIMSNIDVGASATPFLVDIDEDGDLDIVVGEQVGILNYFENKGTPSQHIFSTNPDNDFWGGIDVSVNCCMGLTSPFLFKNNNQEWELLLSMDQGKIWHYDNISGNLNGNFNKITEQYGGISEAGRCYASGADIDDDGMMDIVVGNVRGGIGLYHTPIVLSNDKAVTAIHSAKLIPNPAQSGTISIESPLNFSRLLLFDIQGKKWGEYSVQNATFDIGKLDSGLYFYTLFTEGQTIVTGKLVIKE